MRRGVRGGAGRDDGGEWKRATDGARRFGNLVRRRRQRRDQHQAAGAARGVAEPAVGLAAGGLCGSAGVAVAGDGAGRRDGASHPETYDQARQHDRIRSRKRDKAPSPWRTAKASVGEALVHETQPSP